ncbi:three-helix bundle dimerization domain-containing protein [Streptomyces phaeochromogenes]
MPHRAATGTQPCAERGRTGEAVPDPRLTTRTPYLRGYEGDLSPRPQQPGRPAGQSLPGHPTGRPTTPAAEQRAGQDVQARLERRFPDVPAETLATTAAESFAYFADARVRHYVPVLAFKRASRQLSGRFDTRDDAGGAA